MSTVIDLDTLLSNSNVNNSVEWTVDAEDFDLFATESDPEPTRAEIRKWPQALKDMRKLELHRRRMARFRNRRAVKKNDMNEEYRRLEQKLEQRLAALHRNKKCDGNGGIDSVQLQMQQLVLEHESLREEHVKLQQELARFQKLALMIQSARNSVLNDNNVTNSTEMHSEVTVRCIESKWQPVQQQSGFRVHFPQASPSFFFHPFTREEFDDILRCHDKNTARNSSYLAWAGVYLGWKVYHGALTPGKDFLIAHVRCSKRIHCSIDSMMDRLISQDGSSKWPIMPTARDIGVRAEINIQTLQKFDEDTYVIVRNYTGGANFRYMCLVQRSEIELLDGKRKFKFYYVLGDSKANARSRDAELTGQDDVQWVTERGGYSLTLSEVDDSSIDLVFDSLGCFKSEEHALGHFTMFGRIVTRWDQLVFASNLLKF
ncbi:hypothetical protein F441_20810 [Phytophthora nicotianae CJ01A1]|uniref:Uncharacterized protein n=3 Tax=Phytophthora nicotianae TaxID=4792 RepID=W2VUS8_PHYNI|nr:hypothetical protein F441_20810 [Phytophthora nicotianae CJ01A1]